jgi:hypothetical protein
MQRNDETMKFQILTTKCLIIHYICVLNMSVSVTAALFCTDYLYKLHELLITKKSVDDFFFLF